MSEPPFTVGPFKTFRSRRSEAVSSPPATPTHVPTGQPATRFYPHLIQHYQQARNGHMPEMTFARKLASSLNHCLAYRRKTFFAIGDYINRAAGAAGTATLYRFYCHTGYASRYLTFELGLGLADTAIGAPTDPRAEVVVTHVATGNVVTYTAHHGMNAGGDTDDNPQEITTRVIRVPAVPAQDYHVAIRVADYGRILDCIAYEEAAPNIDTSIDYFFDSSQIAIGAPITDAIRERLLIGFSQVWRRNGPQLLTIPAIGNTYASTTWANVIDDSTAAPSVNSPGFWLGDGSLTLEQLARVSANKTVNVVLAAYASMSAGSTGEVRLQDASGTRCSLTGISTTAQWYTTQTTIANLDTLAKVDVQGRTSNAANTMTLEAVSLFCYLA